MYNMLYQKIVLRLPRIFTTNLRLNIKIDLSDFFFYIIFQSIVLHKYTKKNSIGTRIRAYIFRNQTNNSRRFKNYFCFNTHTGVDYGHKTLSLYGRKIKIAVWDTAGQEVFKSIARSYYSGAAACVLVYNITNHDSFLHVSEWLREARLHSGSRMLFALVGNKT